LDPKLSLIYRWLNIHDNEWICKHKLTPNHGYRIVPEVDWNSRDSNLLPKLKSVVATFLLSHSLRAKLDLAHLVWAAAEKFSSQRERE